MEEITDHASPTEFPRHDLWAVQGKSASKRAANQEAGTDSHPLHKSPLRGRGPQTTTRTPSEGSSLPAQLHDATLEDRGPGRRAPKRSNDDAQVQPPLKYHQIDASNRRTPSRTDSFNQRQHAYPIGSPNPGTSTAPNALVPQVTSPQGSRVSNHAVVSPVASQSSDSVPGTDVPFLKQPATRPISEQQLINEVKGIYAGLVMVEKKCVEIVTQQSQSTKRLENQQWKALVALHRTLLQEHHDFFSASQHPTASEALKRLAIKYAMPARMWRHGIHAFLELLRHRLPDSMEHMLSFIYLSYSMMALLKESVPSFVETWIECLGDLARYRMAIEDSDPRDREIWSNVARMWYNEAADKSPNVGRIQHHLAVLARPNITEQLFYYTKALVSVVTFTNARESIMLLFDMFVKNNEQMQARYLVTELSFVHAHAILFTRGRVRQFYELREQFNSSFSSHLDRAGAKMKLQGPQIAMSLLAGMIDFAKDDSRPYQMYQAHADKLNARKQKRIEAGENAVDAETHARNEIQAETFNNLTFDSQVTRVLEPPGPQSDVMISSSDEVVALACGMFQAAITKITSRIGDTNIVPFMHAVLSSLWGWSFVPGALVFVEAHVPWDSIVTFLNTTGRFDLTYVNIEKETFPPHQTGYARQLSEDFLLRGFMKTHHYYPPDFWTAPLVDEDERTVEKDTHQAHRTERCLWLGLRLASLKRYLTYDYKTKQFACTKFAASLASADH